MGNADPETGAGAGALDQPGRILSVYHINIVVRDLDRSEAFYERLGFRTVARFDEQCPNLDRGLGFGERTRPTRSRAAFMKLGTAKGVPETVLDLSEWVDPVADGEPLGMTNIGLARIALRVDDLDAVMARLESEGVEFFAPAQTISTLERKPRFACFKDPDGIILELVEV